MPPLAPSSMVAAPWRLLALDAGGGVLHEQALPLQPSLEHGREGERRWSVRIPYPAGENVTLMVRDGRGNVRAESPAQVTR